MACHTYATCADGGFTYSSFCKSESAGVAPASFESASSQQKPFKLFGFALKYGTMANSKRLVCFYCNKKSDLRYDGQMQKWTCATCEAVNYLDEVCFFSSLPCTATSDANKTGRMATLPILLLQRRKSLQPTISDIQQLVPIPYTFPSPTRIRSARPV